MPLSFQECFGGGGGGGAGASSGSGAASPFKEAAAEASADGVADGTLPGPVSTRGGGGGRDEGLEPRLMAPEVAALSDLVVNVDEGGRSSWVQLWLFEESTVDAKYVIIVEELDLVGRASPTRLVGIKINTRDVLDVFRNVGR
ncbi:hypothetical protein HYQ46_006645 [Verticillium longisporum]|nr:hypothetical protein HYQ46_006645 [Verticillium longisporum]